MTDMERAVADALCLSAAAADKKLDIIQRNITTARAELIRSGISSTVANDDTNALVADAIICFCISRMCDESDADRVYSRFMYQQDNLRKSSNEE